MILKNDKYWWIEKAYCNRNKWKFEIVKHDGKKKKTLIVEFTNGKNAKGKWPSPEWNVKVLSKSRGKWKVLGIPDWGAGCYEIVEAIISMGARGVYEIETKRRDLYKGWEKEMKEKPIT